MTDYPNDRRSIDQDTLRRLQRAGWHAARDVWGSLRLPKDIELFASAKDVLREFGGLRFSAPSGLTELDPSAAQEIVEEIKDYETLIGHRLYPIGIVEGGDTIYILIDERGVVYALAGWLEPLASTFEKSLKYLSQVFAINEDEKASDLRASGLLGLSWKIDSRVAKR